MFGLSLQLPLFLFAKLVFAMFGFSAQQFLRRPAVRLREFCQHKKLFRPFALRHGTQF
jgi:hypothetical protein